MDGTKPDYEIFTSSNLIRDGSMNAEALKVVVHVLSGLQISGLPDMR